MCLPRTAAEESSNQSVFARCKRDLCEGPLEGGLWGVVLCQRSLLGAHRGHCILLGEGKGQSQSSRVWEPLGHLSCVLQPAPKHSCLLPLKEAGPGGGGVPSHWRAGLKGPRPGGSRMTGQGLTEASEGRGGRRGPLQQALRLFGRPWRPPRPLSRTPFAVRSEPSPAPPPSFSILLGLAFSALEAAQEHIFEAQQRLGRRKTEMSSGLGEWEKGIPCMLHGSREAGVVGAISLASVVPGMSCCPLLLAWPCVE